jgi:hypothetical protein
METRPLDLYLREQRRADRDLARLLLSAANDAEARVLARAGSNISARVQRAQLTLVAQELRQQVVELWPQVDNVVRQGILNSADAAARAESLLTNSLYNAAGIPAAEMAAAVRQQARQGAENLYSRKVVGRDLSQRVYRTSVGAQGMVQGAVNKAIAQGRSWRSLASDVKGLINPRVPGGVSYAAERLARTEMNNAFHETQKRMAQPNPFITGMQWHLSSSHPEGDICDSLAGDDHEGMGPGVFSKQNVPSKPHPQDLCYLAPVTVDEDEFVRNFHKGKYDEYLDDIVEDMPVPMSRTLAESNTDELGQFVLQGREAGKSWAQIANEAKANGLSSTSSPGAMRSVARKHGIVDTGSLKKGPRKPSTTTTPAPRPTVPTSTIEHKIGDVVDVVTLGGKTERMLLTRAPSRLHGSNYVEYFGQRVNAYGKALGRSASRIVDPVRVTKVDIKLAAPSRAQVTRAAAKRESAKRTSGVAEREVKKYFRQFDDWDEAHVAKMQRKYKELADEYLHNTPTQTRQLPMVRGKFNKTEIRNHDSAFGLYGGMEGATIRMHGERYFNRHQLRSYRASQRRQVKTHFKAERHVDDDDIYTFVHEFGHHIEAVITSNGSMANKLEGVFQKFFNYMENRAGPNLIPESYETLAAQVTPQVRLGIGYDVYGARFNAVIERFKPDITMGLSKYATENWMEFMAECFAEYKLSPNPRPIAKMFGQFIDEVLHL